MRNKIREIRKRKGREWTLQVVAEELGTTAKQLSRLERGERSLTIEWVERIARALECDPHELISDRVIQPTAPVVGYVGAGAMYYPDPATGPWNAFDQVAAPPDVPGAVAVIVRGGSMEPAYRPDDLLFFVPTDALEYEQCVGRDCVVQVQRGPAFIKRLEREAGGRYRLVSYGAEPIDHVRIDWAAPVLWIRRA